MKYETKQNIICYFDILGYKQLLYDIGENEFIHYIVCAMDTIKEQFNHHIGIKVCYHIFSDNVMVFSPTTDNASINEILILEYIKSITILQRNLMGQYGIFIRGCVTIGNIYYSGDFIYGSGLINAYYLENKVAIYPRILIDKSCINMLNRQNILYNGIQSYICKDNTGVYFVNYLYGFKYFPNWDIKINDLFYDEVVSTESYEDKITPFSSIDFYNDKILQSLLEKYRKQHIGISLIYLILHKILVEYNIKKYKNGDERCYMKYIWCKEYHNKICKQNEIHELYIK